MIPEGMDPAAYVRDLERNVDLAYFQAIRRTRLGFAIGSGVAFVVAALLIVLAVEIPAAMTVMVLVAIVLIVLASIGVRYAAFVLVQRDPEDTAALPKTPATVVSFALEPPTLNVDSNGFSGSIVRHAIRLELAGSAAQSLVVIDFVPPSAMVRLQPRATVDVRVDPDDPAKSTLDWPSLRPANKPA